MTLIVGTLLPTSICHYHFFLLSDRDILIPAVRNTLRALFWLRICFTPVFEVSYALKWGAYDLTNLQSDFIIYEV